MNTSTIPMWQSELSKAHNRGLLVLIEGALIAGGIMISVSRARPLAASGH
jgi:hypothetical protein